MGRNELDFKRNKTSHRNIPFVERNVKLILTDCSVIFNTEMVFNKTFRPHTTLINYVRLEDALTNTRNYVENIFVWLL